MKACLRDRHNATIAGSHSLPAGAAAPSWSLQKCAPAAKRPGFLLTGTVRIGLEPNTIERERAYEDFAPQRLDLAKQAARDGGG